MLVTWRPFDTKQVSALVFVLVVHFSFCVLRPCADCPRAKCGRATQWAVWLRQETHRDLRGGMHESGGSFLFCRVVLCLPLRFCSTATWRRAGPCGATSCWVHCGSLVTLARATYVLFQLSPLLMWSPLCNGCRGLLWLRALYGRRHGLLLDKLCVMRMALFPRVVRQSEAAPTPIGAALRSSMLQCISGVTSMVACRRTGTAGGTCCRGEASQRLSWCRASVATVREVLPHLPARRQLRVGPATVAVRS